MWKYGKENFVIAVLEEREKFWITELGCKVSKGYNQSDGGKTTPGLKH